MSALPASVSRRAVTLGLAKSPSALRSRESSPAEVRTAGSLKPKPPNCLSAHSAMVPATSTFRLNPSTDCRRRDLSVERVPLLLMTNCRERGCMSSSESRNELLSPNPFKLMLTGSVSVAAPGMKALKSRPLTEALMSADSLTGTSDIPFSPMPAFRLPIIMELPRVVSDMPLTVSECSSTEKAPWRSLRVKPECSVKASFLTTAAIESLVRVLSDRLALRPLTEIWPELNCCGVSGTELTSYLTEPFLIRIELALRAIFLSLFPPPWNRSMMNA